jgi:hypothetical protein
MKLSSDSHSFSVGRYVHKKFEIPGSRCTKKLIILPEKFGQDDLDDITVDYL